MFLRTLFRRSATVRSHVLLKRFALGVGVCLSFIQALPVQAQLQDTFVVTRRGGAQARGGGQAFFDVVIRDPVGDGINVDIPMPTGGSVRPTWSFMIHVRSTGWGVTPQRATGLTISMDGYHHIPPHRLDIYNNRLPLIPDPASPGVDIPVETQRLIIHDDGTIHPDKVPCFHFDTYGFLARVTPHLPGGLEPSYRLDIRFQVRMMHWHFDDCDDPPPGDPPPGDPPSEPRLLTFGSTSAAGTFVSYDAATHRLHTQIGFIDAVSATGTLSAGVDPLYAGDPILSAQLHASDLFLQGPGPAGGYVFGPGQVTMGMPGGASGGVATMSARFEKYTAHDTTKTHLLTSYALLRDLNIDGSGEVDPGFSKFLVDFGDVNLGGKGVPWGSFARIAGMDLAIVTPVDLAAATAGFTASISGMPCSVFVCGNETPRVTPPVLWNSGAPHPILNNGMTSYTGFLSGNASGAMPQRWAAIPFTIAPPGAVLRSMDLDWFTVAGSEPASINTIIWRRHGLNAPHAGDRYEDQVLAPFAPGLDDSRVPGAEDWLHEYDNLDTPLAPGDYYLTVYGDGLDVANTTGLSSVAWVTGGDVQPEALEQSFMWRSSTFPTPGFEPYNPASLQPTAGQDPDDRWNPSFTLYGDIVPVLCVADVDDGSGLGNPDGGVGIEDLIYYLALYTNGAPRADVDDGSGFGTPDGGVGIEDLLYYLVRYNGGC